MPIISNPLHEDWSIEKAGQYYNLPQWSGGYFQVDDEGDLALQLDSAEGTKRFKLSRICADLKEQGIQTPLLLRFIDILQHRVMSLCQVFNEAIAEVNYQNNYTICYPIKVNQMHGVVEGIFSVNQKLPKQQVGLEAGSKPELMAVLAQVEQRSSTIVCNGYKDPEYIRTALIASRLGHKVFIVIEKLTELQIVLKESAAMGIEPRIGVRARLASKGESKWQDSGGDHSKFGLSASQILTLVDTLKQQDKLHIFQLLHFHLGSQITSIQDIQNALRECSRYYAELVAMGVPIGTVDVGGGLGVDYEGTQSQSHCSVNYTLREYANNVVGAFFDIAEKMNIPHPAIITESGRALTAHHAMLVANVIDSERPRDAEVEAPDKEHSQELHDLWTLLTELQSTQLNNLMVEIYHKADYLLLQIQEMFNHGLVNLAERALAERVYRKIIITVKSNLKPFLQAHFELIDELNGKLASKFFVNFSIFQSLPDAWAVEQIFPMMPLVRLNEIPNETAVIQDITCDSDGMLKQYVNQQSIAKTIDLPSYEPGEEYLLGFFMIGAYQEILGDMHNLFGDTHAAHMKLNDKGELEVIAMEEGDDVEDMLNYVDYNADWLLASYERQLKASDIPEAVQTEYMAELSLGISGYTYLEE